MDSLLNKRLTRMRRSAVFVFAICWGALALLALAGGTTYKWPDYLHVTYGFPLQWGIHTLDTFIGPVDKWSVDVVSLLADLIFWSGTLLAGVLLLVRARRPAIKPT